jgi:hypothetical protein
MALQRLARVKKKFGESVAEGCVWVVNVLDLEGDDIVAPLQSLADDTDPMVAARGTMLLELVRYLHSRGSKFEACAMLLPGEQLMLYPSPSGIATAWIEVELPEQDPAQRIKVARYVWRVTDRVGSAINNGSAREPATVERVIMQAFGWL